VLCRGTECHVVLVTAVKKDGSRQEMTKGIAVPVDTAMLLVCAVIPVYVVLVVIQCRLALQARTTVRPWQMKAHMRICVKKFALG
jgi:hypothetical protein